MDYLDELKEEILVEEGNVNNQIYEAAMEEAFLYHTLINYMDLTRKYGAPYISKTLESISANKRRQYVN